VEEYVDWVEDGEWKRMEGEIRHEKSKREREKMQICKNAL